MLSRFQGEGKHQSGVEKSYALIENNINSAPC